MKILKSQILIISLLFAFPLAGFARSADDCRVMKVPAAEALRQDDLAGAGLTEAAAASLNYLGKLPANRRVAFCDREFTVADLRHTLSRFQKIRQQYGDSDEFYQKLAADFEFLVARRPEREPGSILATGYFEPLVEGSMQSQAPFIYPVYRVPPDLVSRNGEVGRIDNGQFLPYWTRAEIENNNLLAGQELVFLDDPVEAFILQVQGSGRVRLRDGSIRRILFGAKNGRPYRSIGRLLVERGAMALEQVSLPSIITYLENHPEQRQEILHHNESFVFFRWGDDANSGPFGNLGQPLTAGRSVALDQKYYPPGSLAFVRTRKPLFNASDEVVGWAPLYRLVFNQDTGSAISGPGRLDLFLGGGARARIAAGLMKVPGRLYLLAAKK